MSEGEENQSFLEHLEVLRKTLLRCIYALVSVLPFMFYFSPKVLDFLIKILLSGTNAQFSYFSPTEVFLLQIKTAVVLSLTVCFPYIAVQLWNFILPALYENEKKIIKSKVILSVALFVFGVAFCLFVILPYIIKFGLSFSSENIKPVLGISNVIGLALWLSMIFGFMFQIPLITHGLIRQGVISYESVADKRPYVIVGLLIIAGILTPPDVVSQLMLGAPTYLLFEAGLFFSKFGKKNTEENQN